MPIILKLILSLLGIVLILVGIVIMPLPGPFGVPIILAGLILTLKFSFWAKRQFVALYEKYPHWFMPFRRMLRKRAKIASIIWRQMLKAEQWLSKGKMRLLVGLHSYIKHTFCANRLKRNQLQ